MKINSILFLLIDKYYINKNKIFKIDDGILQLDGSDNNSYKQDFADFDKTLAGLTPANPTLLMCHDPTNWDK